MQEIEIGVVGLGYVGLPLALALSEHYDVIGYDASDERINDLSNFSDPNGEASSDSLKNSNLRYTADYAELATCDVYIVTVPTPVRSDKTPDLSYLENASGVVGSLLRPGCTVVYESTVYPGCTDGFCKDILERASGLKHGSDFFLGYSPERINPADKVNTLSRITKIVSGCCEASLDLLDQIYSKVTTGGVFRARSIKVAEAAKITENIQRDVNIGLMNELSGVYNKIGISSSDVLEAAATKWNFLPFRPGLVGGHCIGVDPYYMIHLARELGAESKIIEATREVNEGVIQIVRRKIESSFPDKKMRILVLGLTFKENCPDFRNSKALELAECLLENSQVDAMDPYIDRRHLTNKNMSLVDGFKKNYYDCIVIAVKHDNFTSLDAPFLRSCLTTDGQLYDLPGLLGGGADFSL